MRRPLRTQILWPMAAVVLAAVAAVTFLNAYLSVQRTRAQIERQLRDVARTLAESTFPLTDAVLVQMRGLSGAEYVVHSRSGAVLSSSDRAIDVPPAVEISRWNDLRLSGPLEIESRQYLRATISLHRASGPNRETILHILYPEQSYRAAWREAVFPSLLVGGIAVVLVVLLAAWIAARVSRPMSGLMRQVAAIAGGDFRPMPLPNRDDEVRDLAGAVNRMALLLADYEDEVRRTEQLRTLGQVAGGIAHQLRNSVTGCRIALDLHRGECPLESDSESLDVAVRQLALIEQYIQRFLSREDKSNPRRTNVSLAELVERVLPLLRPSARHVGVELECSFDGSRATVEGDEGELEQIVINLVINAIDAAARRESGRDQLAERKVVIALEESPGDGGGSDGKILLEVRDTGSGPPPHVREKLFEPLVTARPDGTGLGLSISRSAVEDHGGTIRWERRDGWTCFIVELPRAAQREAHCVETAGR